MLSELDDAVATLTCALEGFDSFEAARQLMGFIDERFVRLTGEVDGRRSAAGGAGTGGPGGGRDEDAATRCAGRCFDITDRVVVAVDAPEPTRAELTRTCRGSPRRSWRRG